MDKINKDTLVRLLASGTNHLIAHKEEVNDLNVFPVPDGDTGTNMGMTVQSALRQVTSNDQATVAEVAAQASRGALMGARGNSGVILSQLFRGFAEGLEGLETMDIPALARALKKASETSYAAVMKPTEGTILTVAREAGDYALKVAKRHKDIILFLEDVHQEAQRSLDRTPDLLPVLKEAGVVDAGGMGLVKIIEGALLALKGQEVVLDKTQPSQTQTRQKRDYISTDDIKFGYCTEFIVVAGPGQTIGQDQADTLKETLTPLGDSMLVVADQDLIKVHIHTNNPGRALESGLEYGFLRDIKIDNMRIQHEEVLFTDEEVAMASKEEEIQEAKPFGFLSVCSGEGMASIFKDLGVDHVVTGGQTMNPSTEDLLEGVKAIQADDVFILPNNSNIILAAEQTVGLADTRVHVIPTKSIPQGVAACLAFNPEMGPEENKERIEEALDEIVSAEVTFAVKDTGINGQTIKKGDIMGICGKKILSCGQDIHQVTKDLVTDLVSEDHSLISLYYGEDVKEEDAISLQEDLEDSYPDLDIEILYGGQPLYYYLVSLE